MNMTNNNHEQENLILKKRIATYRSPKGYIKGLPDDLILDIIRTWERWTGTAKSFYQSIGLKKDQLGPILKKGKKLAKEGPEKLGPFTPVEIKTPAHDSKAPIVLNWDKKRSIRFYQVDHLVEFLKKAA